MCTEKYTDTFIYNIYIFIRTLQPKACIQFSKGLSTDSLIALQIKMSTTEQKATTIFLDKHHRQQKNMF